VNSPEAILADNSARRFCSRIFSTFFTPLSTDSGSLPFEEEAQARMLLNLYFPPKQKQN
jgi:hypothetical protein